MRENTGTARYFHSIDPSTALAGVAEQLRSLSAVVVVRRRKPPYFLRTYPDNLPLAPLGRACCPYNCSNYCDHDGGCRKDSLHFALLFQTCLGRNWFIAHIVLQRPSSGEAPTCSCFEIEHHCSVDEILYRTTSSTYVFEIRLWRQGIRV